MDYIMETVGLRKAYKDNIVVDDVNMHISTGVTNELSEIIEKLPKEKQQRIINAVRALVE